MNNVEIINWFAYKLGGRNASPNSPGRLVSEVNINNAEEVVDYLLKTHKEDIESEFKDQINNLKIKNYDLSQELENLKESYNLFKRNK